MIKEEIRTAPVKEKRIFFYVLSTIALTLLVIFILFRYEAFASIVATICNAFMPFFCGLIIAFVLNAFVNLFEHIIFAPLNKKFAKGKIWNKIERPITLILSYFVLIALVSVIIFFIIPEFVSSCENFFQTASVTFPEYMNNASKWLSDMVTKFNLDINLTKLQSTLFGNFQWDKIIENATKVMSDILPKIVSATVNVASGVFTLVMSLIYSAYFLAGKEKLIAVSKRLLYAFSPKRVANKIAMIMTVSNNVFSCYVRGQLTECVILGTLCYIGMTIIGLDYALLISVILTICALIPILGAYIGAALGAIILFMVRPIDALWFLIFLVCLQQFEGNVIYPRVVGSSIGLPGIWTLTAVMVFGSLFGIPGIIIGTPTAAVAYKLLRHQAKRKLSEKQITADILDGSEVRSLYADVVLPPSVDDVDELAPRKGSFSFSDIKKKLLSFFSGGKH